eukprot:1155637-Pelagomonas_calceolata.AAC.3
MQVDWLTEKMRQNNFTVASMHGDMVQKERDAIMQEFSLSGVRTLAQGERAWSGAKEHGQGQRSSIVFSFMLEVEQGWEGRAGLRD